MLLLLDGDCIEAAALVVEGGEKVERKLPPLVLVPRGVTLLPLADDDDDVPVTPGVAGALLCSSSSRVQRKHKHNRQTKTVFLLIDAKWKPFVVVVSNYTTTATQR